MKGLRLVVLDHKQRIRKTVKQLCKELAKPGVRNLTFVVERGDPGRGTWNIQSTHYDDVETSNVLAMASAAVRQP